MPLRRVMILTALCLLGTLIGGTVWFWSTLQFPLWRQPLEGAVQLGPSGTEPGTLITTHRPENGTPFVCGWDWGSGRRLWHYAIHLPNVSGKVRHVELLRDSRHLLVAVETKGQAPPAPTSFLFAPPPSKGCGNAPVFEVQKDVFYLLDAETGLVLRGPESDDFVSDCSPDGRWITLDAGRPGNSNDALRVCTGADGKLVTTFQNDDHRYVYSYRFGDDSKTLAIVWRSRNVPAERIASWLSVYEMRSARETKRVELPGGGGPVYHILRAWDGRRLTLLSSRPRHEDLAMRNEVIEYDVAASITAVPPDPLLRDRLENGELFRYVDHGAGWVVLQLRGAKQGPGSSWVEDVQTWLQEHMGIGVKLPMQDPASRSCVKVLNRSTGTVRKVLWLGMPVNLSNTIPLFVSADGRLLAYQSEGYLYGWSLEAPWGWLRGLVAGLAVVLVAYVALRWRQRRRSRPALLLQQSA